MIESVTEIADGLIQHNTIYYDGATFARQIGLLPGLGVPRRPGPADRVPASRPFAVIMKDLVRLGRVAARGIAPAWGS